MTSEQEIKIIADIVNVLFTGVNTFCIISYL